MQPVSAHSILLHVAIRLKYLVVAKSQLFIRNLRHLPSSALVVLSLLSVEPERFAFHLVLEVLYLLKTHYFTLQWVMEILNSLEGD